MNDRTHALNALYEILKSEGWKPVPTREGIWVEHRCGSRAPMRPPSDEIEYLINDRAAKRVFDAMTAEVQCYCVPGPPDGWDPDDDLPATRGDIRRLERLIRKSIRGER